MAEGEEWIGGKLCSQRGEFLLAAREFAAKGIIPIPVRRQEDEKGKIHYVPLVRWKEVAENFDPAEVEKMPWDQADGIAIVLGLKAKNGKYLACIDFDFAKVDRNAQARARAILMKMKPTLIERTKSGGLHAYFYCNKEPKTESKFLANFGVEVLGKGHLVTVSPTPGYQVESATKAAEVEDINAYIRQLIMKACPDAAKLLKEEDLLSPALIDYQLKTLADIMKEEGEREWIVDKLIPAGSLVILAGRGGVGKSFVALQMIADIANEQKVLGYFEEHGSSVLLVDEENDPITLKERAEMLGVQNAEKIKVLNYAGVKLDTKNGMETLREAIRKSGAKLVILDSWTQVVSKIDENKAVQVNNLLYRLKKMAIEEKCTFLIIHHLRKNMPYVTEEKDELRGSSVLLNTPDIVLLLENDPFVADRRILKMVKNRFGPEKAYAIIFAQDEEGKIRIECEGEILPMEKELESCVRVLLDFLEALGTSEVRTEELRDAAQAFSRRTFYRALQILQTRGILEKVKKGVYRVRMGQESTELPLSG
jgi:KaiC/GvpD/RAD55 family RecA-like ATPase